MKKQYFLSAPRTEETVWFLRHSNVSVTLGLVGIGVEDVRSAHADGSNHPLMRSKWTDGSPAWKRDSLDAAEALAQQSLGERVTVLTTGPVTDVAKALLLHPEIAERIDEILILGGSESFGDVTPAAERNFYNDPEAAWTVLNSGVPIVLFGLELWRETAHPTELLARYLHDPSQFATEAAGVQVETRGTITLGKCVNDLNSDKQFEKNVLYVRRENASC